MDNIKKKHSLYLEDDKIEIRGVTNVALSDDKNITVDAGDKTLSASGENLSILKLDLEEGVLTASGRVLTVKYGQAREKQAFLKKFFK